jgi:hypothetical protein
MCPSVLTGQLDRSHARKPLAARGGLIPAAAAAVLPDAGKGVIIWPCPTQTGVHSKQHETSK